MQLLFIRHAESIGNWEKRILGQCQDKNELTACGQEQAQCLSYRLKTQFPPPTHVYTSPLIRAVQTATILISGLTEENINPHMIQDADLQELNAGILQGLTWTEAQQKYPQLCHRLESQLTWIPIPGGESLQSARHRAQRFITRLLNQHDNDSILWVITHGGFLPYLVSALWGGERVLGFSAGYASVFELWIEQTHWFLRDENQYNSQLWQIRRFNDSCQGG